MVEKPRVPILNPQNPLATGLMGAWLFYEGGGTWIHDSSLHGHLGTFQGTLPTWIHPYRRLSFGGRGSINCGRNDVLDANSSLTIVVIGNGATPGGFWISKALSTTYDYGLYVDSSAAGSLFYGANAKISSTGSYFISGWHQYVVTASSAATIFYRDGVIHYTAAGITLVPQSGKTLLIGARATNALGTTADFGYVGQMELAYVYNRALTHNEILALYFDPYTAFRQPAVGRLELYTSTSTVQLSWTDNSGGAQTFSIERSTTGPYSGFSEIATGEPGPTYNDTNLAPGTYWYRVRGVVGSEYSDYINPELIAVT